MRPSGPPYRDIRRGRDWALQRPAADSGRISAPARLSCWIFQACLYTFAVPSDSDETATFPVIVSLYTSISLFEHFVNRICKIIPVILQLFNF